jgi:hypothetical protein
MPSKTRIDEYECFQSTQNIRFDPSVATECKWFGCFQLLVVVRVEYLTSHICACYAGEDLWKAAESGLLEDLPKAVGVIVTVNSTTMSDDESDITGSQMIDVSSNYLVRDLKRRLEKMEKENRELKQLSEKRQRRAPKKSEKGENFKPLKVIKVQDRLNEATMYVVGKSKATNLFRNMKYFIEIYKNSALQHAFRILNFDDKDKEKYADYVLFYIDNRITAHRNNIIHQLKRLVLGLVEGGKS